MTGAALALALVLVLAAGSADVGIHEVKKRHQQSLLATAGVVSVGIGLAGNGEQAIVIGIAADDPALRDALPPSLEGYPVVVQPVGTIKSQ